MVRSYADLDDLHSFPTRRSSDLPTISESGVPGYESGSWVGLLAPAKTPAKIIARMSDVAVKAVSNPETRRRLEDQRSEEHTSELQSQSNLVCRLLLEKKKVMTPD